MVERFAAFDNIDDWGMRKSEEGEYVLYSDYEAELSALKKQVEELTAERDAATISGWKAAIDCVSYAAANTYGPRVDPAAVAKARDDLVQELLTASPGDYLDCCWKDAQDAIRAEAEVAALRKALIEARAVVDAVTGHNQPDRPWSRQVRDRIDAALASTKETSDAD